MKKYLAIPLAVLLLAGCDEQPYSDRENRNADGFNDAYDVVVWRNADDVPNVVLFCVDGLRFAATLSGDGTKQPQLVRVPEQDQRCGR